MSQKAEQKKKRGVWNYYQVDLKEMKVKLLRRKCPRCGEIMAFHSQGRKRYYCGKCHYTEFIS